jgi:hypothetical protein
MAVWPGTKVSGEGGVIPTTGTYAAGDHFLQTSPTDGIAYFWNTSAGSPGTWRPWQISGALKSVTFSATPTFDIATGTTQKITLTANVTSSTLSNALSGQQLNFIVCQDSTGSRTFVWPTNVKGAMTIGSTLSTCSAQSFIFDGTNAYATSVGVANQ